MAFAYFLTIRLDLNNSRPIHLWVWVVLFLHKTHWFV